MSSGASEGANRREFWSIYQCQEQERKKRAMSVTTKKRATLEDIRKRMEAASRREDEINTAIEEAREKMNRLAKEEEDALRAGNKEQYTRLNRDRMEAELDFNFISNQRDEVPEITKEEKEEAYQCWLDEYYRSVAAARQKLAKAEEGLRDAMENMTALHNEALRDVNSLSGLLGVDKWDILSRIPWDECLDETAFLRKVGKISTGTTQYFREVNFGRTRVTESRGKMAENMAIIAEGSLSRPAVIK